MHNSPPTCEVVIRTRVIVKDDRPRESLEKCNRAGRDFVVVKRNGIGPARARMCLKHAKRVGDKWLIFTKEYWRTRSATHT